MIGHKKVPPHKLFLTSYSYYIHLTILLEWRPTKVEKSLCDRLKNLNYRTQTTSFTQCIKSPDYLYWNHRHIVITLQKDIDWKLSDRCITTTFRNVFIIHTILMSHWSGQLIVVEPNSRITLVWVGVKFFISFWLIPCCQQLLADFKVEHHSVRKFGFGKPYQCFRKSSTDQIVPSGFNINVIYYIAQCFLSFYLSQHLVCKDNTAKK